MTGRLDMRLRSLALLVAATSLLACDRGVFEVAAANGKLTVRAGEGHLVLQNQSALPIHYVAMEEEISAMVDLYFDPTKWASVDAGSEVSIEYEDLMGYDTEASQARVYWWTQADGYGHVTIGLRN